MFTNKAPCGPKRGHGTPQPRWAQEIQLDKIADHLGLDPAEMRKKHLVPPNSITANWIRIGTLALGECIDKVVKGSGWKDKFRKLPYGKGVGIACSAYMTGTQTPIYYNKLPHSGVQLKLDRSGGVCVYCGSVEIGQGSDSILAYIVAEVLGIDPFDIKVVTGDTDLTPVDLGSYSSRVTLMTGNAAIQAAERARDILSKAVSEKLDVPAARLSFAGRRVFDSENPEKGMSFVDAVWLAEEKFGTLGTTGSYKPPAAPGKYKGSTIGPSPAFTCTATVAEVDVNPETGIVTVPKVWIAHDIGQAINPLLVVGQVEAACIWASERPSWKRWCIGATAIWFTSFLLSLNTKARPLWKCATSLLTWSKARTRTAHLARKKPDKDPSCRFRRRLPMRFMMQSEFASMRFR